MTTTSGKASRGSRQPVVRYWRSECGDWRWHLRAANGEIVAAGEGYVTKAGVLAGIAAMRRNVARALTREYHPQNPRQRVVQMGPKIPTG